MVLIQVNGERSEELESRIVERVNDTLGKCRTRHEMAQARRDTSGVFSREANATRAHAAFLSDLVRSIDVAAIQVMLVPAVGYSSSALDDPPAHTG